jgi:hypothetical protein
VTRPGRTATFVIALAWATAVVPVLSGPASADALCLDRANNFIPCPTPPAPLPTAGTTSPPANPFAGLPAATAGHWRSPIARGSGGVLRTRASSRTHSGRTGALPILGIAALAASAIALIGWRLLGDRSLYWNREPGVVAAGPTPSKLVAYQRAPLASALVPTTTSAKLPATAITPDPLAATRRSLSDASPVAQQTVVPRPLEARDVTIDPLPSSAGPVRLHQLTIDSFAQLAAKLDAVKADDTDLVLALPARAALMLGEPEELVKGAELVDGICVAASAVPLASPPLAERLERAIAAAVGHAVMRSQCFPHALFGPAAILRTLLADLPEGDSDADRLTAAILADGHAVVLDTASFIFHLLDGTGTDVTTVAGRAHVGDKQPLVLIDPAPGRQALVAAKADLADGGAGELARLLRYDGAAAPAGHVTVAAADVRVTPLWSPAFCATVVRAAEVAGLWTRDVDDDSRLPARVSLLDLIPGLLAHLEADLADRVWPLLSEWQPLWGMAVSAAMIVRRQAGGPEEGTVAPHDLAYLIGSVRLNDGYAEGALHLPRQRWADSAVPVGALTVWPSSASHPHYVAPVTKGVKYALHLRFGPPGVKP